MDEADLAMPLVDATDNGVMPGSFAHRIAIAAPGLSFNAIERRTGINHETVRRHLRNGSPSIRFVIAFCKAFDVSADWLIRGLGPMRPLRDRLAEMRGVHPPIEVTPPLRLRIDKAKRRTTTQKARRRGAPLGGGGRSARPRPRPAKKKRAVTR